MALPSEDADLFLDQKLIASRIDFFADTVPNKVVASLPVDDSDSSKGYRDVSVKSFASAVDRAAYWLDQTLADAELTYGRVEVFAYDGPIDLRWLIFFVAAMKTSRTIVFSHTHTAVNNLIHLYKGCRCQALLLAEFEPPSAAVQELRTTNFFPIVHRAPGVSHFLNEESVTFARYNYSRTWEEEADRILVYFQSSGTTGPPKPIGHTNRSLIYWLHMRALSRSDDRLQLSVPPGQRIHCAYHISHVSGCWWYLLSMVYWDTVTVFSPPHIVATLDIIKPVLKAGNIIAAAYPPALLAAVAKDSEALSLVRKLRSVSTGGMMLDNVSAATIYENRDVRLQNNYGSTEMMIMPFVRLSQESWPYLCFHPSAGVDMQPFAKAVDMGTPDNTSTIYENVVVRDTEKYERGWQPVFYLFPQLREYHSKDLFKPHPTEPDLWIYYGRVDDTLMLSNGHKVFVADMQRALQEHPSVSGCLVGAEGDTLFAIVEIHAQELEQSSGRTSEALESLWPVVERANALCATGDRIEKRAVILATPDRPFLRFGKLSVDRRGTYALYREEINKFA